MSTQAKRITEFRVSWQADHEQYWQGHGLAFSDYDECATGCGETLREALDDALDSLAQNDIRLTDEQEKELVAELTSQVKEPVMLDWSIEQMQGKKVACCETGLGDETSEWHYYVNVDVKVEN